MNKTKERKNANAITLIALVVTIVILLILAGVSISMLSGENGIISQANSAKVKNSHAAVAEAAKLEYANYQTELEVKKIAEEQVELTTFFEYLVNKTYIYSNGVVNVEKILGMQTGLGKGNENGNNDVYKIEKTEEKYALNYYNKNEEVTPIDIIGGNKKITSGDIDWETIIENAQVHENQDILNPDIGIGTDGKPVNLDLWKYYEQNGEIHLGKAPPDQYSSDYYMGYIGEINENGEIQGKIPQYIKINGVAYPVVHLDITFKGITALTKAPVIPTTVKTMNGTFDSTSLTETPFLPDSVIELGAFEALGISGTFKGCKSLIKVTNIPDNVTSLYKTFYGCNLLETVPTIPESVTDMIMTFYECEKLSGTLEINAQNVTDYYNCFYGASTALEEGKTLKVTGTCPNLTNIIATKSSNSSIE